MRGTVYTETVVHVPPEELASLAPYQVVIVESPDGRRVTGRSTGERVQIGDAVESAGASVDGVPLFRRV